MVLYGAPSGAVLLGVRLIHVTEGSIADRARHHRARASRSRLPAVVLFLTIDPTDLADGLAQIAAPAGRFVLGALAALRLVGLVDRRLADAQPRPARARHRRPRRASGDSSARRSPCSCSRSGAAARSRPRWRRAASAAPGPRTWARESRVRRTGVPRCRIAVAIAVLAIGCAVSGGHVITRCEREREHRCLVRTVTARRRHPRCDSCSRRCRGMPSAGRAHRRAERCRASRPSPTRSSRAWPGACAPTLVRLDDVYPGWYGPRARGRALARDARAPRDAGRDRAAGGGGTGRVIGAGVLERSQARTGAHHRGVRCVRRGARALDAVRVWVEAPDAVRKRRALERDGGAFDPYWDVWERQWRRYVRAHRTASGTPRCDVPSPTPDAPRSSRPSRGAAPAHRPSPRATVVP